MLLVEYVYIIAVLRSYAAYCYRRSSVVSLSVCHDRETCKNDPNDRDAVWAAD